MKSSNNNSFLDQLNDQQRSAVLHPKGAMMIVAGAGSGKTKVLTYRIAHLIRQGVSPFSILALTFTKKAAEEMKRRIAAIVGDTHAASIWMGTFHAVFAKVLRREAKRLGYDANFTIYDTQDTEKLLTTIIKDLNLSKDHYQVRRLRTRISSFKHNLITVDSYFQNQELMEADALARKPKTGEVYREYNRRCFKANVMDFDDLLLKTNELLTKFPEVLAQYQERFKHILVDEYQDTNHSQYLIVRALADKYQNICVVGDDAQSIYAFRGANVSNMLNFKNQYESTTIYRLEQNYRSTQNIVNAANAVIEKNSNRIKKNVWTANQKGSPVLISQFISGDEESAGVAKTIGRMQVKDGMQNRDFAILYRTNAQSRSIEDALRKAAIKYRVFGGLSFYQRKEVKDVLAYLRIIVNPTDEESLKRIINYPVRKIGQTTIDKLAIAAREHNMTIYEVLHHVQTLPLALNKTTIERLTQFVQGIAHLNIEKEKKTAFDMAKLVVEKFGIIDELKKDDTPEGMLRVENIQELLNGIREFTENEQENKLANFLADVVLLTDFDKNTSVDVVSLMTVHLAKGLEFPCVFVVGMEENLFPTALSIVSAEEIEEERRLFYVALTRAAQFCFLTYSTSRFQWGKRVDRDPSRFLKDLDADCTTFIKINAHSGNQNYPIHHTYKTNYAPAAKQQLSVEQRTKLKKINAQNNNLLKGESSIHHLSPGMWVQHKSFGKGKVLSLEGIGINQKASIKFNGDTGIKKIMLRFAQLKISTN